MLTNLPRWWDLLPALELMEDDPGEGMVQAVAARAADGHWALAYLAQARLARLRLVGVKPGLEARWVNPADGRALPTNATGMAR